MVRNPNTIPEGDTLIEDPIMEPFFIVKATSGGYTVYERVTRGENDRAYFKTICYPSTFNHALKVVARELLPISGNRHFKSIQEYIETWNEIQNKMNTMTTID